MGLNLLNKLKDELNDIAQVDQEPSLEGRQLLMVMSPQKKKIDIKLLWDINLKHILVHQSDLRKLVHL